MNRLLLLMVMLFSFVRYTKLRIEIFCVKNIERKKMIHAEIYDSILATIIKLCHHRHHHHSICGLNLREISTILH